MKNLTLLLLLSFVLQNTSCSSLKPERDGETLKTSEISENNRNEPNELKSVNVFNGKVRFIKVETNKAPGFYKVKCEEQLTDKPLKKVFPVLIKDGKLSFYYSESYHSIAKKHFCYLEEKHILTVHVEQFQYKKEYLKVAKGKVILSKKNQARAAREWHMTKKLYAKSIKYSLIEKPFISPLNSFITSYYGKRRIFNNLKRSQHLGNDFRAKVGEPIPVSNRGKVVFTGNLFYTGNVVIIDHGLNLFTIYAHLSRIKTMKGAVVGQGDIIGLSGMTGRVSGPHLHWGVKLHGHNVDGFSLIDESKREFQSTIR